LVSATGNAEAIGAAKPSQSRPGRWRDSKLLLTIELVIFALIFVADWRGLVWITKTLYLLPLAWISLRVRGLSWADIGWGRYRTWGHTLAIGTAAGILILAFELYVSGPLLTSVTGKPSDLSGFRPVIGNLQLALIYITLGWPIAAFGEEFVYRGYLLNRLAGLTNSTRAGWVFSLTVTSIVFALAHTYQDVTGAVEAGIDGVWLGLLYLACDRKLSVPMIAHGVSNTIAFLVIYLGKYPGM
jgi:membrane protease YdiL (CAAX protease family)